MQQTRSTPSDPATPVASPSGAADERSRLADIARWARPVVWLLDVDAADRPMCLRIAADALARLHPLNPLLAYDALWRREQAASTGIGHGFAVPHARVGGIERPLTAFVRTRTPVPFDAPDRTPVSSLLAILVPQHGDAQDHLTMLALVARIASSATFRERIALAAGADEAASAFDEAIAAILAADDGR